MQARWTDWPPRRPRWQQLAIASAASVAAVVVVTVVIDLVQPYVPVLSLGVLYVFAVLPIAVLWGLWFALPVSIASMLAFNWFFLPPVHTFTLADSENWFALAVYLCTAVVVSDLAARTRRRAAAAEQRERESALLAELATELLGGRDLEDELGEVASRAADVLGVDHAEIELGPSHRPPLGQAPHPLEVGHHPVGTIYTPEGSEPNVAVRGRFLPALAALLAVAVERDRLEREALEAETLRRSDLVKTALLRTVSHDLRSPLTGIATAVGALRNKTLHLTPEDRDELLETIDLESGRLNRLVADLLDLSRLEAGAAAPEREVWALDDLVRQAVASLGAGDRVELAVGEAPLVNVDPAQIQRVLVEPDRERAQVLAAGRLRARSDHGDPERGDRARGRPGPRTARGGARARLRRLPPRQRRRRRRRGSRPRDRARLRRGERRDACGPSRGRARARRSHWRCRPPSVPAELSS